MSDFLLPDLGEGLEEAEIVAWRVEVGDHVHVDQIVVDVETAKAVVEVPVPYAGVVSFLHAEPGRTVAVGKPLISILTAESNQVGLPERGVVTSAAPTESASGNVLIGYGTSESPRRTRRTKTRSVASRSIATAVRPTPIPEAGATSAKQPHSTSVAVISPLVRKLARDAGVDLATVAGTGPLGLIRRCDVDEAASAMSLPRRDRAPRGENRVPLRGLRKAIADKLSRSRREIPEATVWVDIDTTDLLELRAVLNERTPQSPVSLLSLVARFTVLGLKRFPELNARVEGDEIVMSAHVNLGFAAQTDRGLVVPVVHEAQDLSVRTLSEKLAQHTSAARSGTLAPSDLTGGTITLNNYGVFGVDGSAAIINHPEVAILGLGRIIDRPWVLNGEIAIRKISQLTLAFDHRVCDGAAAGGFLRYVADCIESPLVALADL